MGRAPCCDKANVKKGPWSPEEDTKLKEYIDKYGTGGNWIALPQKAGLKRCGKSCRLRWLNYLRPNIKHGDFSDEEDRIICSLFASIGSRWSIIAAQLPGRTDNDIKNYWNTKLKKKLMGNMNAFPASTHPIRKPQHVLSSSNYLNSSSPIPFHQALLPLYADYNTCFYNTSHGLSLARSFNGLEFPSSSSSLVTSSNLLNDTSNNNNSSRNSSVFQTQESLDNPIFGYAADPRLFTTQSLKHADCENSSSTVYNPSGKENSNNFLVFGSDQRSCSSSDGSCGQISYGRSEIKQEDNSNNNLEYIHQNNNPSTLIPSNMLEEHNNNQRAIMNLQGVVDYGNGSSYNYGCFGDDNESGLDSELEAVRRLIISSSSNGFIDENKTEEGKGVYYFDC